MHIYFKNSAPIQFAVALSFAWGVALITLSVFEAAISGTRSIFEPVNLTGGVPFVFMGMIWFGYRAVRFVAIAWIVFLNVIIPLLVWSTFAATRAMEFHLLLEIVTEIAFALWPNFVFGIPVIVICQAEAFVKHADIRSALRKSPHSING